VRAEGAIGGMPTATETGAFLRVQDA
jgi:hypothetical protein